MRVINNSADDLYYLLTDHLSSTSKVLDTEGNLVCKVRYNAWGETRFANGVCPTDRKYTGQLEAEAGLYYYNARWYDPVVGRFIQADSYITNPSNTMDWDHYSYVRNNPIKYIDPNGNKLCDGKDSNGYICDQITNDDLLYLMKWLFGWTTKGSISKNEIEIILETGEKISNYISSTTGTWGQGWVRTNLGNAVFMTGWKPSLINKWAKNAVGTVPWKNEINLSPRFNVGDVIHELGHVLENNIAGGILPATLVGGGPADAMVYAMGGNPNHCIVRWECIGLSDADYYYSIAGRSAWPKDFYANHSVADDFAFTFAYTIFNPSGFYFNNEFMGRFVWMKDFLWLTAMNMQ